MYSYKFMGSNGTYSFGDRTLPEIITRIKNRLGKSFRKHRVLYKTAHSIIMRFYAPKLKTYKKFYDIEILDYA